MARKYILLTSGTSWTVPAGWNSGDNTIHLIGGGGGGGISSSGGGGGGGGGYTRISNFVATPGSTITYAIGAGGGTGTSSTSYAASAGGTTTFNSGAYSAAGGGSGASSAGTGGVGSTFNGGSGSLASTLGGGGGAGGPNGNGNSSTSTAGGSGDAGLGGAGGAASTISTEIIGLEIWPRVAGSGGGKGLFSSASITPAGGVPTTLALGGQANFGGGGGGTTTGPASGTYPTNAIGGQGVIIIEYESGKFQSPEGDLETLFVNDYAMIDQYAATGSLWIWGNNANGQLSDGSSIVHRSSPIQTVSGGTNWKSVSGSGGHITSIKTDGTLWSWGLGTLGQMGNNASTTRSSPVQTVSGGTNWKQSDAGNLTAAIKTDGTLWTWGINTNGGLGDNTIANKSSPVQTVAAGTNWKQVAVGTGHIAAIKTDGTLWLCGTNNNAGVGGGLLGDNTIVNKSSPVQTVAGGNNWKQVACASLHTAAIKTDGTLWTWGPNPNGRLGDNTTTHRSSPVQTVAGGTNWKQVACADLHTAAIKTDGTLWTWGDNTRGQLGDNTTTHRSSPVQTVAGGTNWKQMSGSDLTTASIKTDGTLWLWGDNRSGQLGDNSITHRSSPIQTVAGGTNWKLVSCGNYRTAAIFFYEADKLYPPS